MPEEVTLDLHGVAHRGEAVGRAGDLVAFVAYGLPGERVRVAVTERKPRYLRGRVAAVLTPVPERVTPPCPIFGTCGGCHWQHAVYPAQLRFKTEVLRDLLVRIGRFGDPPLAPAVPSPQEWHYRNAVQLVPLPGRGAPGARRLCFRRAHSHDPVVVEHCYIADPLINRVIEEAPWDRWDESTWAGLSGVEVRTVPGQAVQITLAGSHPPVRGEATAFREAARAAIPELSGLLFAARRPRGKGRAGGADEWAGRGGDPRVLWGEGTLTYELAGERLDVPPGAFAQVNLGAAERLVARVLEWLGPGPGDVVLDVYAGVGTFSLPLARRVAAVLAVESHPGAAGALSANAARAGLVNVQVQARAAEGALPRLKGRVDLAVLDPPRRGCSPEVLAALARLAPRRIAYVSCEPSTLARDLRVLVEGGYRLRRSGVVDLFPQTFHTESCTLLEVA